MKLTIFGAGYVGLVTGVGFAELGHRVCCVDIDNERIERLSKGDPIIYEQGLKEKLERNLNEGRISFATSPSEAEAYMICVGTPQNEDGSVDLTAVMNVTESLAPIADEDSVVVLKSTVPVGTASKVAERVKAAVVSNPEFLREGAAVNDFFNPDRIIVGMNEEDDHARQIMERLYSGIKRTNRPILFTDNASAELIKYASNAMLATRISFMNQLSAYCEKVGADITTVAAGMGLDDRIGPRFLHAGIGYGGSCFPKDVKGLINQLQEMGCPAGIIEAVDAANEHQKRSLFAKIEVLGPVKGKRVAVWGLSFKPKTDDIREAPSRVIINWLLEQGATVQAFDPEAVENFRREYPGIIYAKEPYGALKGASVLLVVTEWDEFRNPDWSRVVELMARPCIVDGRNIYRSYRDTFTSFGIRYIPVGAKPIGDAE